MAYPSRADYIDPPNWNQQRNHQLLQAAGGGAEPHQLLQSVVPPPLPDGGAAAAAAMVRPNSMVERARLAKIPLPEHALKCPRCDSTNTKFCYFNNYSLSQPRHFCKTCRRYWTRGGALRNVPVGGGCRRNKRSKSGGAKSTGMEGKLSSGGGGGGGGNVPGPTSSIGIAPGLIAPPQLPLLASFSDYGLGLHYGGVQGLEAGEYPTVAGLENWRPLPQFPCFAGVEASPAMGFYGFNGDGDAPMQQGKATCAGLISQLASVKMEENSLPRHYLGLPSNDQYWAGGVPAGGVVGNSGPLWTDLSGISSNSPGSLL